MDSPITHGKSMEAQVGFLDNGIPQSMKVRVTSINSHSVTIILKSEDAVDLGGEITMLVSDVEPASLGLKTNQIASEDHVKVHFNAEITDSVVDNQRGVMRVICSIIGKIRIKG